MWFSSKTRSLLTFLFTWTTYSSSDWFIFFWSILTQLALNRCTQCSSHEQHLWYAGEKKDQNVGFWDLLPHCLGLGVLSGSSSKHCSTPLFIDLSTTFDLNRTEYSSYSKMPKTAVRHPVKRKCPVHNVFTGDALGMLHRMRQSGKATFCTDEETSAFQSQQQLFST